VLGGGYRIVGQTADAADVAVRENRHVFGAEAGWLVTILEAAGSDGSIDIIFDVYAICAAVAPGAA
jgi:hypothetical protein